MARSMQNFSLTMSRSSSQDNLNTTPPFCGIRGKQFACDAGWSLLISTTHRAAPIGLAIVVARLCIKLDQGGHSMVQRDQTRSRVVRSIC